MTAKAVELPRRSSPGPVSGGAAVKRDCTRLFAGAVFLGAFLLFSVQPMVAKYLLPSFGGTAGVWATCLAVFQVLLLGGYLYAHWISRMLTPQVQRWSHLSFLALSLLFLPITPQIRSSAEVAGAPVLRCAWALISSVGLPFLALSATSPLLMDWFRRLHPHRTADRLYAFSNAGSLLALLLYPVAIDPLFTRRMQAVLWAAVMLLFVLLCAVTAWKSRRAPESGPEPREDVCAQSQSLHEAPRTTAPLWLWLALPACSTGLLLALTNQICQDVTPVPLLWVAPMGVYLLTFILCFEGPRTYRRGWFLPVCMAGLLMLAWMLYYGCMHGFLFQIAVYLAILFVSCMVCHGELYRIRPPVERLTLFYLCIAVGGALGGIFVAMVAPLVFKNILETPILTLALALLISFLVWRERVQIRFGRRKVGAGVIALFASVAILFLLGWVVYLRQQQSIYWTRSFYGVYQVKEGPTWLLNNVPFTLTHGPGRVLVSGQVYHGFQFLDPVAAKVPTTYFSPESGLNLALREMPTQTNRSIGVIGLGTGTVAAYGRPGDHIRYYELNPDVLRIARRFFTYLSDSAARIEVVLGDGRISLERETNQHFDLLVLDAFSGDSIPTHLLTAEAMRVYLRHLSPDGVLAFHISNNHLDLEPVVRSLAEGNGLKVLLVPPADPDPGTARLSALWMLLSPSDAFARRPAVAELISRYARSQTSKPVLWTDDHFSILPILR